MTNIIIFGNCQAGQLKVILNNLLSSSYSVEHISNNSRTGNMKSLENILNKIKQADILIYQPLGSEHGKLSEKYILSLLKSDCIKVSFPYIFNSGIYSLCHAPQSPKNSYGVIYGEDIIIECLNSGLSRKKIIKNYEKGKIDFRLRERFDASIKIMSNKETYTDIKLVDFIKDNYKKEKLFSTHNHPTNSVFFEMIKQIGKSTGLNLNLNLNSMNTDNLSLLGKTNCPVSPYDIKINGYQFKADDDWYNKGKELINLIVNEFLEKKNGMEGIDIELSVGTVNSNNVTVNCIKNQADIDCIRDVAITLEKKNIYTSLRLMSIAHKKRPMGAFILMKLQEYEKTIGNCKMSEKVKLLVSPGLPRSGTTYTFHNLVAPNNKIFFNVPKTKEINFFKDKSTTVDLLSNFNTKDKEKIFIDYSPSYFVGKNDFIENMIALKEEIDFKFILHLRHPIDQMYAHYLHYIKAHISKRQFGDDVEYSFFSQKSLQKYSALRASAVKKLIDNFGAENILPVNFYKDIPNPQEMNRKISTFLDIDVSGFASQKISPGGWLPYYVYGGDHGCEILVENKVRFIPAKNLLLVNGVNSMLWKDVDNKIATKLIQGSSTWTREVTELQFQELFNIFESDWNDTLSLLGENVSDYKIKPQLFSKSAPVTNNILSLTEEADTNFKSRIINCTYTS